jgi:hypothetical protein
MYAGMYMEAPVPNDKFIKKPSFSISENEGTCKGIHCYFEMPWFVHRRHHYHYELGTPCEGLLVQVVVVAVEETAAVEEPHLSAQNRSHNHSHSSHDARQFCHHQNSVALV